MEPACKGMRRGNQRLMALVALIIICGVWGAADPEGLCIAVSLALAAVALDRYLANRGRLSPERVRIRRYLRPPVKPVSPAV